MKYPKDLTGLQFERLTVLKRVEKPSHLKKVASYWLCVCICGNERILPRTHLVTSHTISCGCFMKEMSIKNLEGLSERNTKHGMSGTRFYEIWKKMKHRCYNSNNKNYHNYGGRGISVCDKWQDFEGFMKDMHNTYIDFNEKNGENTATIERVNVDGNYCIENCTWLTIADQQWNRRDNRKD